MPSYDHICQECNFEWSDFYSVKQDPPKVCPQCNVEGKVKRLISDNISVKMVLSNREFQENLKNEQAKIAKQVKTDENFKANLAGEEKYQNMKSESDRIQKTYGAEMAKLEKKLSSD